MSRPCRGGSPKRTSCRKPNAGRVPVIIDGDRVVHDSTAIAEYLEERYADRPSLFGGETGRGADALCPELDRDRVADRSDPARAARYPPPSRPRGPGIFSPGSREKRFGAALEEVVKDREARLPAFRASLDPLRRTVERQDFVAGKAPAYADYIVFGAFQWARAISDFELLAADDPVRAWRGRMLDLFDGLARRAPPMAAEMDRTAAIATVALIVACLGGGGLGRRHVFRAAGAAAGHRAARTGAAARSVVARAGAVFRLGVRRDRAAAGERLRPGLRGVRRVRRGGSARPYHAGRSASDDAGVPAPLFRAVAALPGGRGAPRHCPRRRASSIRSAGS